MNIKNLKSVLALSLFIALGSNTKATAQINPVSNSNNNITKTVEQKCDKKLHKDQLSTKLCDWLKISEEDLVNAQKNGKTWFDLAGSRGYTPDQVRTMTISIKTELINKAVADGKLTKEQGDAAIKELKEKVPKWNGTIKSHDKHHKHGGHAWSTAMKELGISKEDLHEAQKSGKTVFDLAKEKKGMNPDQVRAVIIKAKTDAINKKVSEGKMSREKGDEIISKIKSKIEKWDGTIKPEQ